MDHAEATRRFSAEQYLLGEMSEAERDEFEQHFFECTECTEALESGAYLVANTKAVFREQPRAVVLEKKKWFSWGNWGFAPAAALAGWAVAAVLAGVQFLHGPAESAQFAMAPAVSVRSVRSGEGLTFSKRSGMIALTVANEWEDTYSRYQGTIERTDDHNVVTQGEIPATKSDITISVRPERFPTGSYLLTIYGLRDGSAEKAAVARIPFTLTE
jgi:hypothetical protein